MLRLVILKFFLLLSISAKADLLEAVRFANQASSSIQDYPSIPTTCPPDASAESSEVQRWGDSGFKNVEIETISLGEGSINEIPVTHYMDMQIVMLRGSNWDTEIVLQRYNRVREVFLKCGIDVPEVEMVLVDPPEVIDSRKKKEVIQGYLSENPNLSMTQLLDNPPAELTRRISEIGADPVFDISPTDGENPSSANFEQRLPTTDQLVMIHVNDVTKGGSLAGPEFSEGRESNLYGKQWIEHKATTSEYRSKVADYCLEAHEIGHVLLNEGHNNDDDHNFMHVGSSDSRSDYISPTQCNKMKEHHMVKEVGH